jgi:tetratricopeptide (TPR) repeat protein
MDSTPLGEQNAATLVVESLLATLYHEMERFDDAQEHAVKTYQLRKAVLGASNVHTLFSQGLLALLDLAQGRIAEAQPLYQDFLEKTRGQRDRLPPFVIWRIGSVGLALLKQQEFADADEFLRFYLDLVTNTQPVGWRWFDALSALGAALMGQKRFAEAEPLLTQGYEGLRKYEAQVPVRFRRARLTDALERLVQFYTTTDNPAEAARWRGELQAVESAGKSTESR